MITQEDFVEWKKDKVTVEFFKAVEMRIVEIQENLVVTAGLEPLTDRFLVGMIHAYKEVPDVEVETIDA